VFYGSIEEEIFTCRVYGAGAEGVVTSCVDWDVISKLCRSKITSVVTGVGKNRSFLNLIINQDDTLLPVLGRDGVTDHRLYFLVS
jgi:hypothetical protein